MSELYDQVQDHEDRIATQEDYSSNNDSNITDIQSQIDDMGQNVGQLEFPLTQETIDLIKEQFPNDVATLSGGTATITDSRISPISNILLTVSVPGGTQGFLSYAAGNGSAVITSTDNSDTSTVVYLLLS